MGKKAGSVIMVPRRVLGGVAVLAALVGGLFLLRPVLGLSLRLAYILSLILVLLAALTGSASFFLKKRQAKKKAAGQAGAAAEVGEAAPPLARPDGLKRLEEKWRSGLATLRSSQLKEKGDPVLALPWYVLLGRPGSGKSSAVRNSQVPTPYTGLPALERLAPTENLDWWFLDPAVILDTTGRYAFGPDGGEDRGEWRRLVELLGETRPGEALNGVVVAVSVEDLQKRGAEELSEDAKNLRDRIDSLITASGMYFPVYVMITKSDLIDGFSEYCRVLPGESRAMVLGAVNDSTDPAKAVEFFETEYPRVVERLRRLRLSVLTGAAEEDQARKLFLFPEEMARFQAPLAAFVRTLFAENPYLHTPLCRAVLFTSARQQGEPLAGLPRTLGLEAEPEAQTPGLESYFLRDFFGRLLKNDRGRSGRARPIKTRLTRPAKLGLAAWSVLWAAVCVLLLFSFSLNRSVIDLVTPEMKAGAEAQGQVSRALRWVNLSQAAINNIYERNRTAKRPRLGLHQSLEAEASLRARFVADFSDNLRQPLDKSLNQNLGRLVQAGAGPAAPPKVADFRNKPDSLAGAQETQPKPGGFSLPGGESRAEALGRYVKFILDRIGLLKHSLANPDQESLQAYLNQPDFLFWLASSIPQATEEQSRTLKDGYLAYLLWRLDDKPLQIELGELTSLLDQVLADRDLGGDWLIQWANSQERFPAVTCDLFWGQEIAAAMSRRARVEPAFTAKAWTEGLKPMVTQITRLAADADKAEAWARSFRSDYWRRCQDQWAGFLTNIQVDQAAWTSLGGLRRNASYVLSDKSAYLTVLARAGQELAVLADQVKPQGTAPWVPLLLGYHRLRKAGADGPGRQALLDFEENLGQVLSTLQDKEGCYRSVQEAFKDGRAEASSASPALRAEWSLGQLSLALGGGRPGEEPFWKPLTALLDFGWRTQLGVAGILLQQAWESQVAGDKDKAGRFIETLSDPFLVRGKSGGYEPKSVLGLSLPFTPEFVALLKTSGAKPKAEASAEGLRRHWVRLEPVSVAVNQEASQGVDRTTVKLVCGDNIQTLEYSNAPVSKMFVWVPTACQQVLLEFDAGPAAAVKEYSGLAAVAQFLTDIAGGRKTYDLAELKKTKGDLEPLGISQITVSFKIRGHQPVLEYLESAPAEQFAQIPERIIRLDGI